MATKDQTQNQTKPQTPEEKETKKVVDVTKVLAKVEKKKAFSFKFKKQYSLIIGGGLVLIFFIFIITKISPAIRKSKPPAIEPSPRPTKEPEIASPSAYATDSAVLKIEKELLEIEKLLKEIQFREPSLLPPEVDMEVKFKI